MPTAQAANDTLDPVALLTVLTAFRKGDFSKRMPLDRTGVAGKISDTLNEILDLQANLCKELTRVSTVVGKEGQTSNRAKLTGTGGWQTCVESVNALIVD